MARFRLHTALLSGSLSLGFKAVQVGLALRSKTRNEPRTFFQAKNADECMQKLRASSTGRLASETKKSAEGESGEVTVQGG